jgi:Holliday junction DNA helicase RuvB
MDDQRIISPEKRIGEGDDVDRTLRPPSLAEFTGQGDIKESLSIAIEAAKHRGDSLDHCLFAGPPGLGKTTLAGIIAKEMGVNIHITSGPVLDKASDLAGLLTSLQENDVLFIDEIHRLNRVVEEYLYPAMEVH